MSYPNYFCDECHNGITNCTCVDTSPTMSDMYPLELENPCHEWEQIWDDGVGVRCCVCAICGEHAIFEYEVGEE